MATTAQIWEALIESPNDTITLEADTEMELELTKRALSVYKFRKFQEDEAFRQLYGNATLTYDISQKRAGLWRLVITLAGSRYRQRDVRIVES